MIPFFAVTYRSLVIQTISNLRDKTAVRSGAKVDLLTPSSLACPLEKAKFFMSEPRYE